MTDISEKREKAIDAAFKLRRKMIERGVRSAWTHCPACGGRLNARLAGKKNHLHASCETDGCLRLMQ